jgi:hypothetical protein
LLLETVLFYSKTRCLTGRSNNLGSCSVLLCYDDDDDELHLGLVNLKLCLLLSIQKIKERTMLQKMDVFEICYLL